MVSCHMISSKGHYISDTCDEMLKNILFALPAPLIPISHYACPTSQLTSHPSLWTDGIVQHCTRCTRDDADEGQAPQTWYQWIISGMREERELFCWRMLTIASHPQVLYTCAASLHLILTFATLMMKGVLSINQTPIQEYIDGSQSRTKP